MNRFLLKLKVSLALFLFSTFCFAQGEGSDNVDMMNTFRTEGKIYVVVLVIAIVFTGMVIYMVNTDRKVSKIEKELDNLKSEKD